MEKCKLKKAKLWQDDSGAYFLYLKYEVEDNKEVREIVFPKVGFPISNSYDTRGSASYSGPCIRINCGLLQAIELPLHKSNVFFPDEHVMRVYSAERVIETKTKKMTVAEIEEALGYKVEIIAEE